jgi:hypothetical protein
VGEQLALAIADVPLAPPRCWCGRRAVGHDPAGNDRMVCQGHNERAWAAGARRTGDLLLAANLERSARVHLSPSYHHDL